MGDYICTNSWERMGSSSVTFFPTPTPHQLWHRLLPTCRPTRGPLGPPGATAPHRTTRTAGGAAGCAPPAPAPGSAWTGPETSWATSPSASTRAAGGATWATWTSGCVPATGGTSRGPTSLRSRATESKKARKTDGLIDYKSGHLFLSCQSVIFA